ncbi:MAG: ribokinase [Firmicutes bacterium]|nr:ribokinase [Bacillota bacterium]
MTVLGSYNLGVTYSIDALPVWGQTLLSTHGFFSHGGKGSNQAVTAARFGASVRFVGAVGQDAAGISAREMLLNEGIDVSQLLMMPDYPTGIGTIFLDDHGHNAIVVNPGANAQLRIDTIDWPSDAVLLAQLEVPVDVVRTVFAQHSGIRILNPAPADASYAKESWDWVDILTPNETEARILCGLSPDDPVASPELLQLLAKQTHGKTIVLTLGSEGVLIWHHGPDIYIPAVSVETVDTTGAGDVFNGILAAKLAQGESLPQAACKACLGASLSVRWPGVIPAIPSVDEVDRTFEERKQN